MKCVAFLGVIRKDHGIFYYELFDKSVNTEKFVSFLRNFKSKHGKTGFHLYLDNLAVHRTKIVKDSFREMEIIPIYTAPYSPELNPIEFVFSFLK